MQQNFQQALAYIKNMPSKRTSPSRSSEWTEGVDQPAEAGVLRIVQAGHGR